jgi:hypothetical protein
MYRPSQVARLSMSLAAILLASATGCDSGSDGGADTTSDTDVAGLGPCTSSAECQAGAVGLAPCEIAVCDAKKKACVVVTAAEHATCDDGDPCTLESWCVEGACTGGSPVKPDCDDSNPCTGDGCQPGVGCVHSNITAPCDDGNSCTEDDACASGQCRGNPTAKCSCSVDGHCAQFEDGDRCNGTLRCVLGACALIPESVIDCPPAGPCQEAVCEPTTGTCSTVPASEGEACSDGSGCSASDVCAAGVCAGAPVCACEVDDDCSPFEDGDACNGVLICSAGFCIVDVASVPNCADEDPADCLRVSCDPVTGECATKVKSDGSDCTTGDVCFSSEACLEGACTGGVEQNCDDDNACTLDVCVTNVGCEHQPAPGKACDDGDPCTSGDVCQGTVCVGPNNSCVCGDGFCAASESCSSCPNDCGSCCGNGLCDSGEDANSCAQDCGGPAGCGDGFCDSANFEELSCPQDCPAGGGCGDGVCDFLEDFTCPQDCPATGTTCGFLCDGVCDGTFDPFLCPSDCTCGNTVCEGDETPECCAADCAVATSCGDGTCDADETEASCPADCTPVVADPTPDASGDEAPEQVETMPDAGDVSEAMPDVAEPTPDAASDVDAGEVGPDVEPDAAEDTTPDVEPDAAEDTGPDAEPDADAEADAQPDAEAGRGRRRAGRGGRLSPARVRRRRLVAGAGFEPATFGL